MILVTDLKNGTAFKEKTGGSDTPYVVVKYEHVKTARGGATVRIKAKNLLTGAVLEKSYSSNIKVDEADVSRKNAQYLYKDQNGYVFMDPTSYEQLTIQEDTIGIPARFLTEGESVQVQYFEDAPIAVDLPLTMDFEITYTEPGFKGNTVTNTYKDATLANGVVVKVPTFIKIGDWVKIDTRTGDYISKA